MPDHSQKLALFLTASEAERLVARLSRASFLRDRAIEVFTAPADDFIMGDGSKHPGAYLFVRAPNDLTCGMGIGFVTALSEGVN